MTFMDVRIALRPLRRQPAFAAGVIGVLALAIGANAAVFTLTDAVLFRPLPLAEPDRLIGFSIVRPGNDRQPLSLPDLADFQESTHTLAGIASLFGWSANLTGQGDAERLSGMRVSANYFAVTGAQVALGRPIQPDDEQQAVALLCYGTWQRRFGAAADVVGRPIVLNGQRFTIIGVLRPDFVALVRDAEIVVPYSPATDARRSNRGQGFLRVIARVKPGVTVTQATDDLTAIGRRLRDAYPDSHGADTSMRIVSLHEEVSGRSAPMLWTLLGAVVLVMLVACANLSHLFLVRGIARRREMAVRTALGASRRRIVTHLLMESVVLGVIGGGCGLLVARVLIAMLLAVGPADLPRAAEVAIDLRVAAATLLMALGASLLLAIVPTVHACRGDLGRALQQGGRGSSVGGRRGRWILVCTEVAMSTLLLMAAALLVRSFQHVQSVDPGFRPAHVLSIRLSLPRARYDGAIAIDSFYQAVEPRIGAIAGVRAVAAGNVVPMNGYLATVPFFVDGVVAKDAPEAHYRMISPDYFRALGIEVRSGRPFGVVDGRDAAPVAIINETFARQYFAGRNPIGCRMRLDDGQKVPRQVDIVGVVNDVRHFGLEKESTIEAYVPIAQVPDPTTVWLANNMYWIVQTDGEPLAVAASVRREIAAVDPAVSASFVRSMDQWIAGTVAPRRFTLQLVAAFAIVALLLAAVGIYAVSAAAVTSRTHEIGIRSALGASRLEVIALVLRDGLSPVVAGLAAGVAMALVAGRALAGMLFDLGPADPASLAAGVGTLALAAVIANLAPVRRAVKVDPIDALRCQ